MAIPEELHHQLKLKAVYENKTLKALIIEIVEKEVKNAKGKNKGG